MKRRFEESVQQQGSSSSSGKGGCSSLDSLGELIDAVRQLSTEAKIKSTESILCSSKDKALRDERLANIQKSLDSIRCEKSSINQRRMDLKATSAKNRLPSEEFEKLGTRLKDLDIIEQQLTKQLQQTTAPKDDSSKFVCLQSLQRSLSELEMRVQQVCSQEEGAHVCKRRRLRTHSTERVWAWLQSTANAINISPQTSCVTPRGMKLLREAHLALIEGNQCLQQYYCTDHESVESCWSIDPEPVLSDSAVQVQ
eukprot:TRINITY_DN24938_c0_g3_i1.p3 TRINITY_DN24938_c0_g3~~TRINITY_DN24938_c0_g3_i1.p3  ORF type:complete len:254 (+),score=34.24 TRINITY_DN24938_c0_g3_i1:102-863(+)